MEAASPEPAKGSRSSRWWDGLEGRSGHHSQVPTSTTVVPGRWLFLSLLPMVLPSWRQAGEEKEKGNRRSGESREVGAPELVGSEGLCVLTQQGTGMLPASLYTRVCPQPCHRPQPSSQGLGGASRTHSGAGDMTWTPWLLWPLHSPCSAWGACESGSRSGSACPSGLRRMGGTCVSVIHASLCSSQGQEDPT